MTDHVKFAVDDGVMRLTFARPERRTRSRTRCTSPRRGADARRERPGVSVVLFEAEGDAFTAGNDIADFAAVAAGTWRAEMKTHIFLEALARGRSRMSRRLRVRSRCRRHDADALRSLYVAEDARLSTPFVNLALVPEAASTLADPGAHRPRARVRNVRAGRTDRWQDCRRDGTGDCGVAGGRSARQSPGRGEGACCETERAHCTPPRN